MNNEEYRDMQDDVLEDLRGPAVVVHGSICSGFKVTGPFESVDSATDWAIEAQQGYTLGTCSIQLLLPPKTTGGT